MRILIRIIGIIAVIFYIISIFTVAPTKTIQGIGGMLPWISLFISILLSFGLHINEDNYFKTWGWVYAVSTLLYIVVVSLISGSIVSQLPHLGACICFITYFTLEHRAKDPTRRAGQ